MSDHGQALRLLTAVNLDDLVASFGWQHRPLAARLLRILFRAPARKFAGQILRFDQAIARDGLSAAARRLLRGYVRGVRVHGRERLPDGPLLVLSNHPGMTDTLCLFAAIDRPDLRIIALDRPFLEALPQVSAQLIYVGEAAETRLRAVRQAAGHLRQGGSLLTFPGGRIEPDPAVYPGAQAALQGWTDSAGVFLRLAPGTRIVPALVSGVLWKGAVRHPLTRLKQAAEEREKLGAALQLLGQVLFDLRPVTVEVRFGTPLSADALGSTDPGVIHAAVLDGMRALLREPPAGPGAEIRL